MDINTQQNVLKILIIDDSPLFREGLGKLLNAAHFCKVVDHTANVDDAIIKIQKTDPEVVIMDIILSQYDGFTTIQTILDIKPDIKLIILTNSESEENMLRAIKLGVHGYLLKSVEANELLNVLKRLPQGDTYVAPGIAAKILKSYTGEHQNKDYLSPREKDVLKLVVKGLTNKEIARSLNISESTVKNHLTSTMEKFHVSNRVEAAIHFLENDVSSV